jgi:hypothetical protein
MISMTFGPHTPGSRTIHFALAILACTIPIALHAQSGRRREADAGQMSSSHVSKKQTARLAAVPTAGSLLTISTRGPDGKSMPVDGIVCDNLRDTPTAQRNVIELTLPRKYGDCTVDGLLLNPDGTDSDTSGRVNVGSLVPGKGRLIYYPPPEFNTIQEPQSPAEIDAFATRTVNLTVHVTYPDGKKVDLPAQKLVLARPPILLVHGINTGPECWIPFVRSVSTMPGFADHMVELPFTTLDHYSPPHCFGVNYRDKTRYPEGLFAGNGPVELCAALLAQRIQNVLNLVRLGKPLSLFEERTAPAGIGRFAYHVAGNNTGKPLRLAIRRLDVVAYSYGGVITRWYLGAASGSQSAPVFAYRDTYHRKGFRDVSLKRLPVTPYHGDIRKVITLGSMWRGVPLSNFVNEVRFSKPDDEDSLAAAPIRFPQWMSRTDRKKFGEERTAGGMINAIDSFLRVKTPAVEVMAVNSPWLSTLIFGAPEHNALSIAQPFRPEVAYGSVAGDDSSYIDYKPISGVSVCGALAVFQQPPRFPFIDIERRAGAGGFLGPALGGPGDYTDGLVPVWSSTIPGTAPGASLLVGSSHGDYFTNKQTREYAITWLSNATLPTGKVLSPQWNTPVESRNARKIWTFEAGRIEPTSESGLYETIDGIARISPAALHPQRNIQIARSPDGIVTVKWTTPAGGRLRRVTLYECKDPSAGPISANLKRIAMVTVEGNSQDPTAELPALEKEKTYYLVADAAVDNAPDPRIIIKSGFIRIPDSAN